VPYVLSLGARLLMARGLGRGWLLAPLALGWLALFPNAPYLLTDFIHLHQRPVVPLWFDAALLALFAATGGGPRAGARFRACVGSPSCSHIERTPVGAVTYTSSLRRPPHRGQANTSRLNVLRTSPAQSSRAVLCFLGSSTVAAKERFSFCRPASVPA